MTSKIYVYICVFLSCFSALAQTPAPNLTSVVPNYGAQPNIIINWQSVQGAFSYQIRRNRDANGFSNWVNVPNAALVFTDQGPGFEPNINTISNGSSYTYEVRAFGPGGWSPASNQRTTIVQRVWPVAQNNNCASLRSREILHEFQQPIVVNGVSYLHEGLDVQGPGNNVLECVSSPLGVLFINTQQNTLPNGQLNPNDWAVNLQYTQNGVQSYIQFNHLINVSNQLVPLTSVAPGTFLGQISNGIFQTNLSSHTHVHHWGTFGNMLTTTQNPLTIWQSNANLDPQNNPPQLFDTNNDGFSVRYRVGPNNANYLPDNGRVYGPVDIVAECIDRQSTDAPWQIPHSVGYFIQRKVGNSWTNVVRSSISPYRLYSNANWIGAPFLNTNPVVMNALLDLSPGLRSVAPNTPAGYIWQQMFTYQVTNTNGTAGNLNSLDANQCWATDASAFVNADNGYTAGYQKASFPQDAKFRDGEYNAVIQLSDLINPAVDVGNAIQVDNFQPFVEQVSIKSNNNFTDVYKGQWVFDPWGDKINFSQNTHSILDDNHDALIHVKMSEPMSNLTMAIPSLGLNIQPNFISADKLEFSFLVDDQVTVDGVHALEIDGQDLAGHNILDLANYIANGMNGVDFPKRDANGNFTPNPINGADKLHFFEVGCSGNKTSCLDAFFTYAANGLHVDFTDASNSVTAPASYGWNFGDAASGAANLANTPNPQHTFTSPGSYIVTLTVQDADNDMDVYSEQIYVTQQGIAVSPDILIKADILRKTTTIPPDNYTILKNETVSFSHTITNLGAYYFNYHWDFGDGNTSNNPFPVHSYTANGTYIVQLTLTDQYGATYNSNPIVLEVGVLQAPITGEADVTWSPLYPQVNQSVTFINNSIEGSNGPYTYRVELYDENGQKQYRYLGQTYFWQQQGIYDVEIYMYDKNSMLEDVGYQTILVGYTPGGQGPITISDITLKTNCYDYNDPDNWLEVQYNKPANYHANFYFNWSPSQVINPQGFKNTLISTPTFNSNGEFTENYSITITDENGFQTSFSKQITINESPIVNAGPDRTICIGESVTLGGDAATPSATLSVQPYQYAWTPKQSLAFNTPNGIADLETANPLIEALTAGTYIFELAVYGANGCSSSEQVKITVRPSLNINAGPDIDPVCAGSGTKIIGNNATGGSGNYTYTWFPSTDLSDPSIAKPTVSPQQVGSINYTVVVSDGLCQNVYDEVLVTSRYSEPEVDAGVDQTIIQCLNEEATLTSVAGLLTGNPQYRWESGGFTDNKQTIIVTPNFTRTYTAIVTDDATGCEGSDDVTVNVIESPAIVGQQQGTIAICSTIPYTFQHNYSVQGGSPPYTYLWMPATGLDDPTKLFPTVTNLNTSMLYELHAWDANNCEALHVNEIMDINNGTHNPNSYFTSVRFQTFTGQPEADFKIPSTVCLNEEFCIEPLTDIPWNNEEIRPDGSSAFHDGFRYPDVFSWDLGADAQNIELEWIWIPNSNSPQGFQPALQPCFSYKQPGIKTIKLVINTPCGMVTISKTINVKLPKQVTTLQNICGPYSAKIPDVEAMEINSGGCVTDMFPNANVTFIGGNEVNLYPGFTAYRESEFTALIGDCYYDEQENKTDSNPEPETQLAEDQAESTIKSSEVKILRDDPAMKNLHFNVYPNPILNQAIVEYELPFETQVTIKVFNVFGAVVDQLVVQEQQADGQYKLSHNTANLPAGVYFYTLHTPEENLTFRIVKVVP